MDSIFEKARRGQPVDNALVIDSHCHMGHYHRFYAPENNAEGMLESMDALGIDIAFVAAHASIGPDYIYGNDMVIKAAQKYPDRFLGYVTINPHYPDDIINELERCFKAPGIKGIKLHPACHEVPIDYPAYTPVYEYANKHKHLILIHVWGIGQVKIIDNLAGQYPDIRFLMGHSGGDVLAMEEAIRVINRHDNVYGDIALSIVREGNVEWLVDEIGSKKLIYASDMPFFDPRPAFGRVAMSSLPEEQKRDVLGLNMKGILNL